MKKKFVPIFESFEDNFFTILTGFLWGFAMIGFIIWLRIFRELLPRDLTETETSSATFYFVIIMLIYRIIILIIIINQKQREYRGVTKIGFVQRFYQNLREHPRRAYIYKYLVSHVINGPIFVWCFLYYNLPRNFTEPIARFYLCYAPLIAPHYARTNLKYERNIFITTVLLNYIPQFLTLSVFCLEIILAKRLEYFYYSLTFLLCPIVFTSIRKLMLEVGMYEIEYLRTVVFTTKEMDNGEGMWFTPVAEMSEKEIAVGIQNHFHYVTFVNISICFLKLKAQDWVITLIVSILHLIGLIFWVLIILKLY
jgi:hypothetical protein